MIYYHFLCEVQEVQDNYRESARLTRSHIKMLNDRAIECLRDKFNLAKLSSPPPAKVDFDYDVGVYDPRQSASEPVLWYVNIFNYILDAIG